MPYGKKLVRIHCELARSTDLLVSGSSANAARVIQIPRSGDGLGPVRDLGYPRNTVATSRSNFVYSLRSDWPLIIIFW